MCLDDEMAENIAHIGMMAPHRSSQMELISPDSAEQFLRQNGLLPEEVAARVVTIPPSGKCTGPQYLD
ncbi:MAG: hypothetical protein WAU28_03210 [Candidatus Moraniibacteriota bacterium]